MKSSTDKKKVKVKAFEPTMRVYFVLMVVFAAVTAIFDYRVAAAEGVVVVALFIVFLSTAVKRKKHILDQLHTITSNVDAAGESTMSNFPMPTLIIRLDNDEVIWANDKFLKISDGREHLIDTRVRELAPEFSSRWLLEGRSECPSLVEMGGRKYQVFGSVLKPGSDRGGGLVGTTYWMDVTEFQDMKERFTATKPVVGIITLDNYDELVKNQTSSASSALLAEIDDKITLWLQDTKPLICKYDRDRYVCVFHEGDLAKLTEAKFTLLDSVRETVNSAGIAATVSIGIGHDAATFAEAYEFASLATEMSLSRGGDQAVIKNRFNFEFYGGRSKETEKRTKVKSRVMAGALSELVGGASNVFVMGHSMADLDSVGAAVGVCGIARQRGKKAKIVIDLERNNSKMLLDRVMGDKEYADTFISTQQAIIDADTRTLLVVVDTNRPEQVESRQLLDACNHVVVIDHHRRAATYIENAALNFLEPSASSASELVTELIQYLPGQAEISAIEAEALMAGIALDTKNFTTRVSAGTFEAAAYLRRKGADPASIKLMMQNDFDSTVLRYTVISSARMIRGGVSVAKVDRTIPRVTAAQAADELLTIAGIQASIVMYPDGDTVIMSARSLGEVDVQVIMEALGGGGNNATAAAQIKGVTIDEAYKMATDEINKYFDE